MNDFIADSEEGGVPKETKPIWDRILMSVMGMPSSDCNKDVVHLKSGGDRVPKVNGKHRKHVQPVSLMGKGESLFQGNGVAKMIQANIPLYKEVLPGLESWQASKIASWHNLEGHSIQWFCVVCIDRRGRFLSLV